jgi:triphosphoribosyl-dephospho-CoA synthase
LARAARLGGDGGVSFASSAAAAIATAPAPTRTRFALNPEPGRVAFAATLALHDELALYPKPGLVSFVDNGSHDDMTAHTFLRSISSLRDYFRQIALLGARHTPFAALERLGIAAEQHMLWATGGVNTHRGAIFTLGLLCAAGARPNDVHAEEALTATALRARLVAQWGPALAARVENSVASNGRRACRHHELRGAREEAAAGFPSLFHVAVPALRAALRSGLGWRLARLQTFFNVMAALDDTNLVHRGGLAGLRFAKQEASGFLAAGGAHRPDAISHAEAIHRGFVARRLSPGGSADLLSAACFLVRLCG